MIIFREKSFSEILGDLKPYKFSNISQVQKDYNVIVGEPWKKYYKPPYDQRAYNWCWNIQLPECPQHIRLEKDSPYNKFQEFPGYSWSCHFKTSKNDNDPLGKCVINEFQKQRLFGALCDLIPKDNYLCTWGGVYYGAIPAFQRIFKSGKFKVVGYRRVTVLPENSENQLPILKKL